MKITKDGIIRLIFTIIISVAICSLATLVFFKNTITIEFLSKSVLIGSLIWLATEIASGVLEKIWPHTILPSFVTMCAIIIFGTVLGLRLFGVEEIGIILIICTISVFCGLAIAIVSRKLYKNKLNRQLEKFKDNQ